MEHHALDGDLGLERLEQVPGDRLAFAVLISGEQELVGERQRNEALRQQQAMNQQTLMARLATLESTSIGTSQSLSTNQSREAKLVKLPRWMRIGS